MSDQKSLRVEMETRILALINGELTADESKELEKLIANDPELIAYRDQMRVLLSEIAEEAKVFEEETPAQANTNAPTRLSEDRRTQMQALITKHQRANKRSSKTVEFESYVPKEEWDWRRIFFFTSGLIAVIALLAAILIPSVGSVMDNARRSAQSINEAEFNVPGAVSADSKRARDLAKQLESNDEADAQVTSLRTDKNSDQSVALGYSKSVPIDFYAYNEPTKEVDYKRSYSDTSDIKDDDIFERESELVLGLSGWDKPTPASTPHAEPAPMGGLTGSYYDGSESNGRRAGESTVSSIDFSNVDSGNLAYHSSSESSDYLAAKPARRLAEKHESASSGPPVSVTSSAPVTISEGLSVSGAIDQPALAGEFLDQSQQAAIGQHESSLDDEKTKKAIEIKDNQIAQNAGRIVVESRPIASYIRPAEETQTATPLALPEKETAKEPFSTFSLNVSDVSFRMADAALQSHTLPAPSEIRAEEFINAFPPQMHTTSSDQAVRFDWELSDYPFAHDRQLLRFAVQASSSGRLPNQSVNLVLLVDSSGSMQRPDRQAILRASLSSLAEKLGPNDHLSAIVFARTPRVVADGVRGSAAEGVIDRLLTQRPEGGTNLESALQEAYKLAQRHQQPTGAINRVVLLTDGAANLGEVNAEALRQLVTKNRNRGIALDAFGVGWDGYNDTLLEALTRNSDGRYAFLNSTDTASVDFADKLAGALNLAAADVKVQIEWNPKRVLSYRQIGYEKHQLKTEDFRNNAVDAAELAAAEVGQALYVVQLNPDAIGGLGTLRVRYRDPQTGIYEEQAWPLEFPSSIASIHQSSPSHRLAAAGALLADKLAQTPNAENYPLSTVQTILIDPPPNAIQQDAFRQLRGMIQKARQIISE